MAISPHTALRNARKRRERLARDTHEATAALRKAVELADSAGIPKTEIAKLAGVTRPTVYAMLEKR